MGAARGIRVALVVGVFGCSAQVRADPPDARKASPLSLPADVTSGLGVELSSAPSTPADIGELTRRLDAFSKAMPEAERNLLKAAATISPGVPAALKFVQEKIAFEAYPGVLRGPQVTYATRAGNAYDRSVLLAWILGQAGMTTRFARGKLGDADARALFERIFDRPPQAAPPASPVAGKGEPTFLGRVAARAQRDHARIRQALGASLLAEADPANARVIDEIRDHVWVQVQTEGGWTDLDTSFDDPVGKTRCSADSTPDRLPDDVFQTLTLRVVAEKLAGAKLERETVFELTRPTAQLIDQETFLLHLPASVGGLAGAISGVAERDQWRPALLVAGELLVGKPVGFEDMAASARDQPLKPGLGGAFGGGGALGARRPTLIAEWLEIDLSIPGRPRETTRRTLLDRAGVEWRKLEAKSPEGLRALDRDDKGPASPRTVHNLWITAGRHDLSGLARSARLLASSLSGPPAAADRSSAPKLREIFRPFAIQNASAMAMSDEFVVGALNDVPGVRFYADSPRITIFSILTPPGAEPLQPAVAVDLRRDRLRGLARDESKVKAVAERRVWFGALQGAVEHEALLPWAGASGGQAIESTSSRVGRGAVTALGPADAAALPQRLKGRDALEMAASALQGKHRLVVPSEPPTDAVAAWWDVGPDGTTRAVLGPDLNGAWVNGSYWWWEGPTAPGAGGGIRKVPPKAFGDPPFRGPKVSPPGVIPHYPDDWMTDPRWYTEPTGTLHLPPDKTRGGGRPDPPRRGAEDPHGGGNEYTMIVSEQAVPNPLAVLEAYVDKFLVGTSEVATHAARVLAELLSLF